VRSQCGSRRTCARAARTASAVAFPAPSHSSRCQSPTCSMCAAASVAPAAAASARESFDSHRALAARRKAHIKPIVLPDSLCLWPKRISSSTQGTHAPRRVINTPRTRTRAQPHRAPDLLAPAHRRRRRVRVVAVRPAPEPVEQAPQVHRHEEEAGRVRVARAQGAAQEVLMQLHVVCARACGARLRLAGVPQPPGAGGWAGGCCERYKRARKAPGSAAVSQRMPHGHTAGRANAVAAPGGPR
jgi:hypothetical protein